jgi:hypothetical protein
MYTYFRLPFASLSPSGNISRWLGKLVVPVALFLFLAGLADPAAAFVATAGPAIAGPAMLSADWPHHFFVATAAIAAPAVVETGSWSIRGWCVYRGYSIATFYKMKKLGTAPTVTYPSGAPPRITRESDAAWLKRVNGLRDEAAEQERRAKAIAAATKAVASLKHRANRNREVA